MTYLKGFFSKKASTKLPPSQDRFDIRLELERLLKGKPKSFYIPSYLLPLEKETIDELLSIGFIKPYIEETAASILFVPKKGTDNQQFYIDYQWVNQFIKGQQFLVPDIYRTLINCQEVRYLTKIDIIYTFNYLLIYPNFRYSGAQNETPKIASHRHFPSLIPKPPNRKNGQNNCNSLSKEERYAFYTSHTKPHLCDVIYWCFCPCDRCKRGSDQGPCLWHCKTLEPTRLGSHRKRGLPPHKLNERHYKAILRIVSYNPFISLNEICIYYIGYISISTI